MVGTADNVSIPSEMERGARACIDQASVDELASTSALDRLEASLGAVGAREQGIRSQVLDSNPANTTPSPMPLEFQVFGQRFLLDSFVLSQVVYDSIIYGGEKQERWMPSGLDAMAALGNDEAVRLLEPELNAPQICVLPAGGTAGGGRREAGGVASDRVQPMALDPLDARRHAVEAAFP